MEPHVSFATVYLLSEVFAPLIVPLVIVATRRRADGPLIACAAMALICIAALWILSGPQGSLLIFAGPQDRPLALRLALYAIAGATGQAAWVLAVYHAALARHGRWIAVLTAAQVIVNAAILYSSNPCIWAAATGSFESIGCAPPAPLTLHLISTARLIGPAAALAYALRGRLARRAIADRNLALSPLVVPASSDADSEADADLEVRTEHLKAKAKPPTR